MAEVARIDGTTPESQLTADVFVSYAREDRERVAAIVDLLERQRWSVFWDDRIRTGERWRRLVARALQHARCVVVAWSEHSIQSDWVTDEAEDGLRRGILIPILLDPVRPPLSFRGVQTADLSRWNGELSSTAVSSFLTAATEVLSRGDPEASRPDRGTVDSGTRPQEPSAGNPAARVRAAAPVRRFFPHYLMDVLHLMRDPKDFIARQIADGGSNITPSLIFLTTSILLAMLLTIPISLDNLTVNFVTDFLLLMCGSLFSGFALCLAWRIVVGKVKIEDMFAVHFYYMGVVEIAFACMTMIDIGVLRVGDRGLYMAFLEAHDQADYFQWWSYIIKTGQDNPSYAYFMYGGLALVFYMWLFSWILSGWGAYRRLNLSSKIQSCAAFSLYMAFLIPVNALIFLIASAMAGLIADRVGIGAAAGL